MTRFQALSLTCLALSLASSPGAAQELSGSYVGTVKAKKDGRGLAGVEVRLTSPALMGTRVVVTDANGNFRAPLLPPGLYVATVSKAGYYTSKATADVGLGQAVRNEILLAEEREAAAIVEVTTSVATVDKSDVKAATLVTSESMDVLPRTTRGLEDIARLAPGVVANGNTNDRITIRGGQTTGNRVLLNGTDISDNTYTGGNGRSYFVDDSILETQVIQSPVHARYGNFTGGVINAITKSGGNEFSGIFRANLSRPDWAAVRPRGDRYGSVPGNSGLTNAEDVLAREYTLTFGGPLWKDKLWFQIGTKKQPAGASAGTLSNPGSAVTNSDGSPRWIPAGEGASYVNTSDLKFFEGKLTFAINSSHTLEISSSKQDQTQQDNLFGTSNDLDVLRDRLDAFEYYSLMYRGVFGSSATFEGHASQKKQTIQGGGRTGRPGKLDQRVELVASNGTAYGTHNSSFDYNEKKHRDIRTINGNFTWFSPVSTLGSHTVDAGFELLTYSQAEANWQTPTHNVVRVNGINPDLTYRLYRTPAASRRNTYSYVNIYDGREGRAESTQTSFYVNDLWAVTDRWQAMAGLRYDSADAKDTEGSPTVKSSRLSPRFQLTWDVFGDQRWLARAHHATYVGALHSGFVNQFTYTGSPYSERYRARANNLAVTYAQLTDFSPTSVAWDISAAGFVSASGGPTQFVDKNVKAPMAQEASLSLRHTYPNGSFIAFTYANRNYKDFYNDFLEVGDEYTFTPKFSVGNQLTNYRWYWTTDPRIKRELKSLELEWLFNLNPQWSLGGNWTHATLGGNGEGSDSTSTSSTVGDVLGDLDGWYRSAGIPESKYYPDGYLRGDVRNQGLVYLNYINRTASKAQFNASLMLNYVGGAPWSLSRSTDRTASVTAYVDSLRAQGQTIGISSANYATSFPSWTQYYTPRGFMRDNDYFNVDLKLGYDVPLVSKLRFFTEVTVFNVFNHWQTTGYRTTTTGGSAASPTDPKGGYVVSPWELTSTGWQGWGTRDFNDFAGGRSIRLSLGFKW